MPLSSFIPHGFCLAWDPGLVLLQAASDLLIALAYFSIPAALLVFLRQRRDLAFKPVFGLFAAFILACGTTHVFAVITLFTPLYWMDGGIKAITAALSVATAILLWPLLPRALALPSPAALRAVNTRLAQEIEQKDATTIRLRDSEQRLRDLYAQSPAILHATDPDGTLTDVSQRWLDLFGTTRAQALGRNIRDFYEPGSIADLPDDLGALTRDASPHPRRIMLGSGEIRDAEATYTLERGPAGEVRRVLVALTDVTLRTQAEAALRDSEERLRHAQKMEAVGQLTGGIAHDFNNLLTTIMASLEMLEQQGDLDARGRRLAGHALEGARRAARLTSQLLSFSRRSRLTSETLDPEDVVRGISELLAQSAGNRIALTIDGHEPTWAVTADRNQLESAVLNLVINARDAIAQEGSIRIGFANRPLTPLEAASLRPDALPAGDYVGILVTDTGSGMTPAVLARALEPFFTTKSAGAGTGLGLSQTYGFAAQSGGTLRIDTQPGGGTTVEILLPRADPQALPAEPAPTTIRHVGRGQTIILVEQDALLRHTVSEALRAHGYVVQVAADGPAALALLQKRRAADLLLTDIMIPGGMNGMELARAARGAVPALPILFTAGYSEQHSLAPWPEKADLVSKPFAVDELIRRIAERLSASAAPDPMEAAPGAVA